METITKEESVEALSTRLSIDNLFEHIDVQKEINKNVADSLLVSNHEMGAIQSSMSVVQTDIAWIKGALEKTDNRTWYILSAIVVGTLIQITIILSKT